MCSELMLYLYLQQTNKSSINKNIDRKHLITNNPLYRTSHTYLLYEVVSSCVARMRKKNLFITFIQ